MAAKVVSLLGSVRPVRHNLLVGWSVSAATVLALRGLSAFPGPGPILRTSP